MSQRNDQILLQALSSNADGEVLSAIRMLKRQLEKDNTDIHDFVKGKAGVPKERVVYRDRPSEPGATYSTRMRTKWRVSSHPHLVASLIVANSMDVRAYVNAADIVIEGRSKVELTHAYLEIERLAKQIDQEGFLKPRTVEKKLHPWWVILPFLTFFLGVLLF